MRSFLEKLSTAISTMFADSYVVGLGVEFTKKGDISMYLSPLVCFDKEHYQIVGPFETVQTAMVHCLFNSWKQPIYYDLVRL